MPRTGCAGAGHCCYKTRMLIALFADIHGNREALTACLDDARRAGAERTVFLGDLVGYGADPEWVVDRVAEMVADGAVAILGNHDEAVLRPSRDMNAVASTAIAWTRDRLSPAQRSFLAGLPLAVDDGDRLFVHASADAPAAWTYVLGPREALHSFRATRHPFVFCGHTHVPALFEQRGAELPQLHVPAGNRPIRLTPPRRWLAVLGAVGQPRDRNPAACYGLFDDVHGTLTYVRVGYDVERAAGKILDAGLPEILAARLGLGM
jgi:diadenosine tetraphosphatase ApaH/serine/threonine PP2A family protein phosphatase